MRSRSADQHQGQSRGATAGDTRQGSDAVLPRPAEVLLARAALARRYERAQRRSA